MKTININGNSNVARYKIQNTVVWFWTVFTWREFPEPTFNVCKVRCIPTDEVIHHQSGKVHIKHSLQQFIYFTTGVLV